MKSPYDIILKPIISERSMILASEGKYTFKVASEARKIEVKKAVEEIFDVEVAKVNIMNLKGKKKRMGRFEGTTPGYKKAIVTLTEDSDEIEFFQGL